MNNMDNRLIGIGMLAAVTLAGMVTLARGGSLDAPAGPNNPASAMWTLKDIYDVLNTRTTNVTKRTSFAEPTGGPTNGTMHTLNDIMTLVTNRAPVAKTGLKKSYTPYDDGWYSTNVGVAWPNPGRFTTNNIPAADTNVVTDNLTGLMWARNANCGPLDWTNSIAYCTNMNNGAGTYGYTDWRLPNFRELLSLIDFGTTSLPAGHPFNIETVIRYYWTSTSSDSGDTWNIYLTNGGLVREAKTLTTRYVWPVRGGGK